MKLGIDLDGIVVDTYRRVVEYYNKKYNKEINLNDFPSHTKVAKFLNEFYELEKNVATNQWKEDILEVFETSSAVFGAIDTLKSFHDEGIELFYISARPNLQGVQETTRDWLSKHKAPCRENLIINQETKLEVSRQLGISYFIEDAPHHITTLSEGGIKTICLSTNYNSQSVGDNVTRVNNWNEISEIIISTKNKKVLI